MTWGYDVRQVQAGDKVTATFTTTDAGTYTVSGTVHATLLGLGIGTTTLRIGDDRPNPGLTMIHTLVSEVAA